MLPVCLRDDNERMASSHRHPRLRTVLDALAGSEQDRAVRELIDVLGGPPVSVSERLIGAPPVRSKRLRFASGGEVFVHDGRVSAVILNLVPTPFCTGAIDLSEWIPGVDDESDLDAFKRALGPRWHFAGGGMRCFPVPGGYVRLTVRRSRLVSVVVSAEDPKLGCPPEDEDCETCSGIPVRAPDGGPDVDASIEALRSAVTAGLLREETSWVPLADLRRLHDSGLMAWTESQAVCRSCGRALCLHLPRDAQPSLEYLPYDAAMRRPLEPIPPVALWGDAERIAAERDGMRYVDHEPGRWFLVERRGEPHLDARYSAGPYVDDSVLVRLDEAELSAYRRDGHDALTALAERIAGASPWTDESPYRARDLYRGADGKAYRDAVSAAIRNHTWIAEQRRPR